MANIEKALKDFLNNSKNVNYSIVKDIMSKSGGYELAIYDPTREYGFERGFKLFYARDDETLVRADWENYCTIFRADGAFYTSLYNLCATLLKDANSVINRVN